MIDTQIPFDYQADVIAHLPHGATMTRALLEIVAFFDDCPTIDPKWVQLSGEPVPGAASRAAFATAKLILGPFHPALEILAHDMRGELNQ